ncbi:MAG: sigma-54 dependent transcriptional regulator, partial [Pseudomonadales bacterium]|nr:sigma-54 dependent transcriptional regulator [Pseudomonadales bacterium]
MEIIARETDMNLARMLDGYECPAILVTVDYEILATNDAYQESFGAIELSGKSGETVAHCYRVSHGYDVPCDQAGEACPLASAKHTGAKERVLHIHQTPNGREHVDVEILPITDENGSIRFFVELIKPIPTASTGAGDQPWVGQSPAFNKMVELVSRVGPSEAAVLLLGESGSGKELAARAIHQASPRANKPLVTLECAGLTETLFESELFGHVKGAFTGANYKKQGLVEAANGGTLFLDEIGDIPYQLQVKLLRLLETGSFRSVGSTQTKVSDFRLICATHKNLWSMVESGEFRQDLYYRINVFPIAVPSLNERREDIPLIAKSILRRLSTGKRYRLTAKASDRLQSYDYRGNVRELRNVLSRALILANGRDIDDQTIEQCFDRPQAQHQGIPNLSTLDLHQLEEHYLHQLMAQFELELQ